MALLIFSPFLRVSRPGILEVCDQTQSTKTTGVMIGKTQFEKNGFRNCKLREILNSALFNIPQLRCRNLSGRSPLKRPAAQISASKLTFYKRQFYPRHSVAKPSMSTLPTISSNDF